MAVQDYFHYSFDITNTQMDMLRNAISELYNLGEAETFENNAKM